MRGGSTYSAVLFAFCGVLASLPLLVVAMLPALAWQSAPEFVRVLSVLLIWVTLVGALGLVHPVRRALIVTARRLLQVSLPSPALGHRTPNLSDIDRWRAPALDCPACHGGLAGGARDQRPFHHGDFAPGGELVRRHGANQSVRYVG